MGDGATVALVLAGTTVAPALDGVTVALVLAGTTVVLAGITVALAGTTVAPALAGTTAALMAGMMAWTSVAPALAGTSAALDLDLAITMTTYNTDDNTGYGSYSFYRGYGYLSCFNGFPCSCHCMKKINKGEKKKKKKKKKKS